MYRLIRFFLICINGLLLLILGSVLNTSIYINTKELEVLVSVSVLFGIVFMNVINIAYSLFWDIVIGDDDETN